MSKNPNQTAVFARTSGKNAQPLLQKVFSGDLLAAEVHGFSSASECDAYVEVIENQVIDTTYLGNSAAKLGVSAHNKQNDQPGYFACCGEPPALT